jgi:chorismate--pyruvate lyase
MPHPYTDHRWRSTPPPALSYAQKDWLMRPGALTSALRQVGELELRVLTERVRSLPREDSALVGLPTGQPVWVREIAMRLEGVDCVVARSLTPLRASHGVWQGIRRLRTRPLADMLYHDVSIWRSDFEVARLARRSALWQTVRLNLSTPVALPLLARRSVFWRHGQPLLVSETFLPTFWKNVQ